MAKDRSLGINCINLNESCPFSLSPNYKISLFDQRTHLLQAYSPLCARPFFTVYMERYSGIEALEAMPVESGATWIAPGGETGLEESMWQLGFGRGPGSYPERLDEPDCIYYLRTGFCGYGNRCRFNHPRDHRGVMGDFQAGGGEYPERAGQPACQYYLRTGVCKFGTSCKYHHPKTGVGSSVPIKLNSQGYPLRPEQKECSYYVNTGQCKFGVTCKFNHPQPAGTKVSIEAPEPGHLAIPAPMPTPVYPTLQSPSVQYSLQYGPTPGNWPVARLAVLPGHYVPGSYGPMILHPGVSFPGWTPYPTPVTPVEASPHLLSSSATTYSVPFFSATSSTGSLSSDKKEHTLPGRPGQPECQHYLRTGVCKFGPTCKYHHPPMWNMTPKSSVTLSPLGLPLRIGAPVCLHYAQNRVCKFGHSCRFDHPMGLLSYSPSASSLTDVPVAPYPVGSMSASLAPSSSSSDLRPQLLSDSSKNTFSSSLSSMSNSSASIGSMFSKTGPDPESSIQQSGFDSDNASGGSS